MEKRYNLRDTSKMLGLTIRTVREYVKDGRLKAYKLPNSNKWTVDESEIRRLRATSISNEVTGNACAED